MNILDIRYIQIYGRQCMFSIIYDGGSCSKYSTYVENNRN